MNSALAAYSLDFGPPTSWFALSRSIFRKIFPD